MSSPFRSILASTAGLALLTLPGCITVHENGGGKDTAHAAMMEEHHHCMQKAMAEAKAAGIEDPGMRSMMEKCPMMKDMMNHGDKPAPAGAPPAHDHGA